MQLVQAQGFSQGLPREGLFREHGGDAVGAFLALRWIEQNELLNLTQLFQELLGGDSVSTRALSTPRGTLQNRPMRDTSKPANRNRQDRVSYSRLQSAKAREKLEPSAKLNYTVKT